jgi:hypothetical protein
MDEFRIDSLLRIRGEAYIKIPNTNLKSVYRISEQLIPDKFTDSAAYFYINRKSYKLLVESGLDFFYVMPPSLAGSVQMAKSIPEVLNGTGYPTYQQYLTIMDSFRTHYQSICKIDTIGYSINGRLILSARLNSGNIIPGERPVLMYSSTIHGDEPTGYVMMLLLLNDILQGYGLVTDYTALLNETVILINPLANPDGTYFTNDSAITGAKRFNLNNVDLNRSFPESTNRDNPLAFDWQPENSVMDSYLRKYRPSLSANFHSGAEVINYPWDAIPVKHVDEQWYKYISKEYADTAKKKNPKYMSGFPDGITNGFAWYEVKGGRMDYINYYLGGREVTIELSNDILPSAASLYPLWLINRNSFINFLKQGLFGIWGSVTDFYSGVPLKSKILIPGYDKNYSIVQTGNETGRFYRYLYEGNYDIRVEADGFLSSNLNEVQVINHKRTDISFELKPLSILLKDQSSILVPNPFRDKFYFIFASGSKEDCQFMIYNLEGLLVYSNVFISSDGINQVEIDLSDNQAGIYILKLITGDKALIRKIVKAE